MDTDTIEKRRYERIKVPALLTLSDSIRIQETDIVNASFSGIAVENVAEALVKQIRNNQYVGVCSIKDQNIKLSLQPVWYRKQNFGLYSIGFRIKKVILGTWSLIVPNKDLLETPLTDIWGKADKHYYRSH